ncbi:hypothetical protein [Streptomyces diastatochromogenes]|uniref:hypothetical protein n=1 Tax=Streptomyces diastatochromogenes TaxID=42236 RepID=UPI0036C2015D
MTTTSDPATHPVEVRTNSGVLCGELILVDRQRVAIRTETGGRVTLPRATVLSVGPVKAC